MIANLLFSPRGGAKCLRVTRHESRTLRPFGSPWMPRAPVPKTAAQSQLACPELPGIARNCPARNIAPEPVSTHRPPFSVGFTANANEPMLRKGNILDCVDGGLFRVAGTNRPGYNNPAPQGVLYGFAAAPIIGAFVTAIAVIIAARPLPRSLSGWGLLKYRLWASMLEFVLSALNRLTVPPHADFGI